MLKIWGRTNSSNVQKVIWACAELGVPYERIDAGMQFGKVNDPEYRKLNPNGLIPTLDDDGFVLWESNTIVRYIAAKFGYGRICPVLTQERAEAERWMDWQITTAGASLGPIFMNLVRLPPEKRDMAAVEAAKVKLGGQLKIFDDRLASRDYVVGKNFTMGDIPMGIVAYRWYSLVAERPSLPHMDAWYARLCARPAFKANCMLPLT